jgi:hypothetical protein
LSSLKKTVSTVHIFSVKMGFWLEYRGRTLYRLMKIVCGTSFMMYGYDAGVLGGVLLHPPLLSAIGNPTDTWTISMIVGSYHLSAFVTAVGIAFFTLNIRRRGTIIMVTSKRL